MLTYRDPYRGKRTLDAIWDRPGCACPNNRTAWRFGAPKNTPNATFYYISCDGLFAHKGSKLWLDTRARLDAKLSAGHFVKTVISHRWNNPVRSGTQKVASLVSAFRRKRRTVCLETMPEQEDAEEQDRYVYL